MAAVIVSPAGPTTSAVPGADKAPVPAANNADSPEKSPSLPSCESCDNIFAPPDKAALPAIVPKIPAVGAKKGTAAAT